MVRFKFNESTLDLDLIGPKEETECIDRLIAEMKNISDPRPGELSLDNLYRMAKAETEAEKGAVRQFKQLADDALAMLISMRHDSN